MKKFYLICAALLLVCCVFGGDEAKFKLRPIFIIDGDTLIGTPDSTIIRLWGVDAPELDQPWGTTARSALISLVHKRQCQAEKKGMSYNRIVALLKRGELDVGLELLKMGLAWYTPNFAPSREDYRQAEAEARAAKRGLWSDKNPVAPWKHRAQRPTVTTDPE